MLSGTAAIQIAKQIGVKIFTTAGSQEKLDFARELGADTLINYKEENFVEVIQKQTQGPEVKVSFAHGGARWGDWGGVGVRGRVGGGRGRGFIRPLAVSVSMLGVLQG